MAVISVENLVKHFRSPLPAKGSAWRRFANYFSFDYQTITALNGISFSIEKGQRVAFIGPNGAGKSTTIKMLTGIMQPTSGRVKVLGRVPWQERLLLATQISAIFGNSSKLWQHLPVRDTFSILASIYEIPRTESQKRINELVDIFDISKLLFKPARALSLGERMRCELVASFLSNPSVIFLDEPTIGLDITAKARIRDLLKRLSTEKGTTLLLTSHDTDDIESVCQRVIIIDKGSLILDNTLHELKTNYIQKKVIEFVAEEESVFLQQEGAVILEKAPHHLKVEVDLSKCSPERLIASILKNYTIKDLTVEGPSLESIIELFYKQNLR